MKSATGSAINKFVSAITGSPFKKENVRGKVKRLRNKNGGKR